MRWLSTSARVGTFYDVLGVPRTASKAQIKHNFYQLSKKHHPDVSGSGDSKGLFQQVSEAYATLSDDEARRRYDASLGPVGAPRGRGGYAAAYYEPPATNDARRRTAKYAWDYQRRTAPGGTYYPRGPRTETASADATHHYMRMNEEAVRRASARRQSAYQRHPGEATGQSFREWSRTRAFENEHRAETASTLKRFLQVGGIIGVTLWLAVRMVS